MKARSGNKFRIWRLWNIKYEILRVFLRGGVGKKWEIRWEWKQKRWPKGEGMRWGGGSGDYRLSGVFHLWFKCTLAFLLSSPQMQLDSSLAKQMKWLLNDFLGNPPRQRKTFHLEPPVSLPSPSPPLALSAFSSPFFYSGNFFQWMFSLDLIVSFSFSLYNFSFLYFSGEKGKLFCCMTCRFPKHSSPSFFLIWFVLSWSSCRVSLLCIAHKTVRINRKVVQKVYDFNLTVIWVHIFSHLLI